VQIEILNLQHRSLQIDPFPTGAHLHRAIVAIAPGEKLLIERRPVRNWTRRTILSLFLCRKLHMFLGISTETAATRAALFDSTHTHTHLTTLLPGLPSTRKVKPIWILLKQETVALASAGPCKSASSYRQITTPAPHHHFLTLYTPFNGPFPVLPGSAGTRKVKLIWILLKQETVSGSGISWVICKSAPRSKQITTPARHHSVFYRPDAVPAAQPTVSKH